MPRQSVLLLFIFFVAVLSTSCEQPSQAPTPPPTAVSVSPTSTPDPTPVPQETPVSQATPVASATVTPAATPESFMSVQEYAASCGDLNRNFDVDKYQQLVEARSSRDWSWFADWVDTLSALRPPPELADYHDGRTTKLSSQIVQRGLSKFSQDAYMREIEAIDSMPLDLRNFLLQEGCLTTADIQFGQTMLEGQRRMASRGPAPSPPTVRDYAERCTDVLMTTPLFNNRDQRGFHLLFGMDELVPPPELEQFHNHLFKTLQDWVFGKRPWTIGVAWTLATKEARKPPTGRLQHPRLVKVHLR